MSNFASPRFLRNVLWADAATCLATGLLQLAGGTALAQVLGLPQPLLTGTGLFLLAYAAAAAWTATRDPVPRILVGLFAIGNAAWAVGCIAVLATGMLQPSGLGMAWVLFQAATVAVLAELQFTGLRQAPVPGWA